MTYEPKLDLIERRILLCPLLNPESHSAMVVRCFTLLLFVDRFEFSEFTVKLYQIVLSMKIQ